MDATPTVSQGAAVWWYRGCDRWVTAGGALTLNIANVLWKTAATHAAQAAVIERLEIEFYVLSALRQPLIAIAARPKQACQYLFHLLLDNPVLVVSHHADGRRLRTWLD